MDIQNFKIYITPSANFFSPVVARPRITRRRP